MGCVPGPTSARGLVPGDVPKLCFVLCFLPSCFKNKQKKGISSLAVSQKGEAPTGDGAAAREDPATHPCSVLGAPCSLGTWVLLSCCCSPQPATGTVGPLAPQSAPLCPCYSGAVWGCNEGFLGAWCGCSIPPSGEKG